MFVPTRKRGFPEISSKETQENTVISPLKARILPLTALSQSLKNKYYCFRGKNARKKA
jgi:hypothetical protein